MFSKKPFYVLRYPADEMGDAGSGATFDDSGDEDIIIDMSGVDENAGGFQCMPRGMYDFIVGDLVYGKSSKGNLMWTWTLEVTSEGFENRKLFFHTVLSNEQLPRLKKILQRIAPELLQGPFNAREIAEQGTMIGKAGRARVDVRKYEGEDRNNVKDILAPSADDANGDSFL